METEPQLSGMGTTLTVAYTVGDDAFIVHAGDSRAYLLRDRSLHQLTEDHTLETQLCKLGLPKDSPKIASFRHVLTNCLGGSTDGEIRVDIEHLKLADGDALLVCSDGLTGHVSDDGIARILNESPDSQSACDALLEAALDDGGSDNVTVVLGRYAIS